MSAKSSWSTVVSWFKLPAVHIPLVSLLVMVVLQFKPEWHAWRQQPKLRFSETVAVDALFPISVLGELPLRVEWLDYKGFVAVPHKLSHLNLVVVTIVNESSSRYDWAGDITQEVTLQAGENGRILAAYPNTTDRSSPRVKLQHDQGSADVVVRTDYLKPGEGISIVIFHDSPKTPQMTLSGRGKDVAPFDLERGAIVPVNAPADNWVFFVRLTAIGATLSFAARLLERYKSKGMRNARLIPRCTSLAVLALITYITVTQEGVVVANGGPWVPIVDALSWCAGIWCLKAVLEWVSAGIEAGGFGRHNAHAGITTP